MRSDPLTIQERGKIFFHPQPRKNACQRSGSTRPPPTTTPKHPRRWKMSEEGRARSLGTGGGPAGELRTRGMVPAPGFYEPDTMHHKRLPRRIGEILYARLYLLYR
jgi:hypothetical protein